MSPHTHTHTHTHAHTSVGWEEVNEWCRCLVFSVVVDLWLAVIVKVIWAVVVFRGGFVIIVCFCFYLFCLLLFVFCAGVL